MKMSLLLPPPTPCSNSRDYSKDDDSDSDVSEDSAGKDYFAIDFPLFFFFLTKIASEPFTNFVVQLLVQS